MLTEKELIQQLNTLKEIKPSTEWQTANREILVKQIMGYEAELPETWVDDISRRLSWAFMSNHLQPALIAVFIVALLSGSGFFGVQAAKDTKPGDSLYVAKKISEKTQFALTFDEKEKAKLGIEFAGNRAQELDQVLAETKGTADRQKVDQLVNDFRSEINSVKSRLAKINPAAEAVRTEPETASGDNDAARAVIEDDSAVFSADLRKDDKGLQLSDAPATDRPSARSETPTTTPEMKPATTTPDKMPTDPQKILNEAKDSLNNNDFSATLNKLEEASQVITQVNDAGQVKGETEAVGTTTLETK